MKYIKVLILILLSTAVLSGNTNIDELFKKGELYSKNKEYQKSLDTFMKILKHKKSLNKKYLANTLFWIGFEYQKLHKYDKSLNYYTKTLKLKKEIFGKTHYEIVLVYNHIVGLFELQHNYNKSIYYMKQLIKITEIRRKSTDELANNYTRLGFFYYKKATYHKAIEYYKKSIKINKSLGTVSDICNSYLMMGNRNKAKKYCIDTVHMREKELPKNSLKLAKNYSNVGSIYDHEGSYNKALEYYKKSIKINKSLATVGNICKLYLKIGNKQKAKKYCIDTLHMAEKELLKNSLELANIYNNVGGLYDTENNYDKALKYFKKALAIKQKLLKSDDKEILSAYHNISGMYDKLGDYKQAIKYLRKKLIVFEKIEKDKLNIAREYNRLGIYYSKNINTKDALKYFKKALAIKQKLLKSDDKEILSEYHNIGSIYFQQNKVNESIKFLRYSCSEKIPLGMKGKNSCILLATAYLRKKNYIKAMKYVKIAISIENNNGDYFSFLGTLYMKDAQYKKALKAFKKAISLSNFNNKSYISIYSNAAVAMMVLGDKNISLCKNYLQKASNMAKNMFGNNSEEIADIYQHYAQFYMLKGEFDKSEKYLLKSLKIKKDRNSSSLADAYDALGTFYLVNTDLKNAKRYILKALKIRESFLDNNLSDVANSYMSLGLLYSQIGNQKKSLSYYLKVLNIRKQTSEDLSSIYIQLGYSYALMEKYELALNYYSTVLKEKNLMFIQKFSALAGKAEVYMELKEFEKAKNNINLARVSLNNSSFTDLQNARLDTIMGTLMLKENKLSSAMEYNIKALESSKKHFSNNHEKIGLLYNSISIIFCRLNQCFDAHNYAKKAFKIFLHNRDKIFPLLNSLEKKSYLKSNSGTVVMLLRTAYGNKEQESNTKKTKTINQETLNAWLHYKGSILSSANAITTLYNNTKDKKLKATIDEMRATTRLYAKLQGSPDSKNPEGYKKRLAEYSSKIDSLTNAIADKAQSFKQVQELNKITYKDVAATLGKEDLYIDYAKAGEYYYIFTLDSKENITFTQIDSNKSKEIDTLVQTFREEIGSILTKMGKGITAEALHTFTTKLQENNKQTLSKLYTLLIKEPLSTQIKNKQTLIFSPDGALRLLPFETLYNKKSKQYLLESKQIHYIPSGKERVRLYRYNKGTKNKTKKVTVFSNPDYDRVVPQTLKAQWKQEKKQNKHLALTRGGYAFKSLSHYFNPLKGSEVEAEMLKEYYPSTVKEYNQTQASEKKLFSLEEIPKVLHLSTHGFFLNDTNIINPMLKSGIVLAGANVSRRFYKDRGIITALKLSGLNLKGTDLVVLSACETAVVDSNSTEAVSGLSKAFLQAGAKGVLSTLWSVADKESAELMSDFYKESKNHKSYADSLQSAKLNMIHQNLHPFFWAGFVLLGE